MSGKQTEKEQEEIIPLRMFITRHELELIVEASFRAWMTKEDTTRDGLIDGIIKGIRNPIETVAGVDYPKDLKCEVCKKPFEGGEAKFRNDTVGWRHVRCHV